MAKKKKNAYLKGLQWTTLQCNIANMLADNTHPDDITAALDCSRALVMRIKQAIKEGQSPPDLKMAAAMAEGYQEDTSTGDEEEKSSSPQKQPPGNGSKPGIVVNPKVSSFLKLIPVPVNCAITPIMQVARQAAVREWQWRVNMPWENFFDTCLYIMFKDRGITLQGYVVEEEGGEQEVEQIEEIAEVSDAY